MDTNVVERAMNRPVTITRKNSLFAGSDAGARRWAIANTLIQTAASSTVSSHWPISLASSCNGSSPGEPKTTSCTHCCRGTGIPQPRSLAHSAAASAYRSDALPRQSSAAVVIARRLPEFLNVPRLFVVSWPFWQVWTVRVSGCRETHPVGRRDVRELAVNRLPGAVDSMLGSENVDQFRAVECSDLNRV